MEWNWYWLCSIPGFYRWDIRNLLQFFETPDAVRHASEGELSGLPFLKEEQKKQIICHKRSFSEEEEYHKCRQRGIHFISCEQEEYPSRLLQITDYPYGLFVKGNLPGNQERCVAVIGARMCSNYGRSMAREMSGLLAQNGVSVVSGLACGIDGAAHAGCLEQGGKSYGILGSGADICYPRENFRLYEEMSEGRGGIISEYPPGARALPFHFPMRNRIISGLAEIVVIAEAKKKSGSLITADLALEQGREIFAFPGRVGDALSEGCNRLIGQGAGIISDISDFLIENGILDKKVKKKKNCNIVLATAENMVYSCVDSQTRSLQNILEQVDLPVNQVLSALVSLQMKGLISETAKNYYTRNG